MSKSSPAFKASFAAYCKAVNDGADRSVLDPLWQAVMKALHDTPEPPVTLAAVDKCVVDTTSQSPWMAMSIYGCAAWIAPLDRQAPSPLDDDFDRMMREG